MELLDGKSLSNKIYSSMKENISSFYLPPKLSIIIVGNRPDSLVYVNMKRKKCIDMGIDAEVFYYEDPKKNEIIKKIKELNKDKDVKGVMVQLPLPDNLKSDTRDILDTINPSKDVDGLTTYSLGRLISCGRIDLSKLEETDFFISSTVYGVLKFIHNYRIDILGKNIGIIGNSALLGMPLSIILSNMGGTVEICHIDTDNLRDHTFNKDIIISCCGVKGLIKGDMIKDDVVLIDIGINVEMIDGKKKIFGDCEWESCSAKASKMTPVPGGVGPMTICSLLEQTIKSKLKEIK